MSNKENVGTVKWLDDGWHGWINGKEFQSFGIGQVCDRVAAEIPGAVEWETSGGKLTARPSTVIGKMSKSKMEGSAS